LYPPELLTIMIEDSVFACRRTLAMKGRVLEISSPVVMGILNCTPDSFYEGSRLTESSALVETALQMLEDGATFLDVGGYSTRPGAAEVSVQEELDRVLPAIEAILKAAPDALLSIDTFRADVARQAIKAGAAFINDVSGGEADEAMFATVADLQVPYVLMHMRGTPQTMKELTQYDDLLLELVDYFQKKIYQLHALGVKDIILDPGFGFAKNIEQNYTLLKHLNYFKALNLPILVGLSRKSMVYKRLSIPVAESLNGTTVLNTVAALNGADILRVHDVKEAVQAITLLNLL
jgi:dihydropteroate synthase